MPLLLKIINRYNQVFSVGAAAMFFVIIFVYCDCSFFRSQKYELFMKQKNVLIKYLQK